MQLAGLCRPMSLLALSLAVGFTVPGHASPCDAKLEPDPKALKSLARSAAYLRGLPAFHLRAEVTRDEVIYTDFKLQRTSDVRVTVRRPNRMRAEMSGDQGSRLFVYDGTYLNVLLKDENYYGSVLAPATLLELLDSIEQHDIELPLLDLIYLAMGGQLEPTIRDAGTIGSSTIDGIKCVQLAFRGDIVDWQIWVEEGSRPLPRKLVITTTDDPTRPQYSAILRWDVVSPTVDQEFSFSPPANASRLTFMQASARGPGSVRDVSR
jgi:hypothetical protein